MDLLGKIVCAISGALDDEKKLPGALLLSGVLKAAAALYLICFEVPRGVFLLHHHDRVLVYLCYGILAGVAVFGFLEASTGFWVSGDVVRRRAIGKTILWVSILPLVFVSALGGFAFLP